jgi:hypothetical protein
MTMNIADAIVKFGREAVLAYREIADLKQDDALPEIFLGSFIASRLHSEIHLHARVEQSFFTIAREAGVADAITMASSTFGGNADITVYRDGRPSAIVEIKKFCDGQTVGKALADQTKLRTFAPVCQIDGYFCVFVTDVESRTSVQRIKQLTDALGSEPASVSEPENSGNGQWAWQIAVWKVVGANCMK